MQNHDVSRIENIISGKIVRAAVEVHKTLGGPGLLESVYEEALAYELAFKGMSVTRQKVVPIIFKGKQLSSSLRLDLLVEDTIIVECKATTDYNPIFAAQLLTYLRLTQLQLGLVINFGETYVRDGIHRVVNKL